MGFLDIFKKERKVSVKDLREMQEILTYKDKTKKTSDVSSFFEQMRQWRQYEKEIQKEKEAERNEIISQLVPDESEAQTLQTFASIVEKFTNNKNTIPSAPVSPTKDIQASLISGEFNSDSVESQSLLSDADVDMICKRIKSKKMLKPIVSELIRLTGADFIKIRDKLGGSTSPQK